MAFFQRLQTLVNRWTIPKDITDDGSIRYWQERIVFSFLLVGLILGFMVLIPSVWLSIKEDLWTVAGIDIAIYLWVVILFFKRTISFIVRAASIIIMSYVLGMVLLIVIGPFGGGPVWLFFFPIITALLADYRISILSLLVNVLTLVGLAMLIYFGWINWEFATENPVEKWIVIGLNFLLLSSITTIIITQVIFGLRVSAIRTGYVLKSLEQKNIELQESNRQLNDEINAKQTAQISLVKSKHELKDSEIRFKELVNLLPLAYFLVDTDYVLQFVNRKAMDVFGFTDVSVEDRAAVKSFDMVIPADRNRARENVRRCFEGDDIGWIPYRGISATGREFPIEVYTTAVIKDDTIVGVQGVAVDISDRLEKEELRNAKEVAEKANLAISGWVDLIAHEIRTPISGPLSYSKLGLRKLSNTRIEESLDDIYQRLASFDGKDERLDPFKTRIFGLQSDLRTLNRSLSNYFQRILMAAERLNLLLNDLLDLSKLESGKMSFAMEKSDLMAIIWEAKMEMEALISEKGVTLEVREPGFDAIAECDSFRIGQVIRNLLSNAIKYTPVGKKITIYLQQSDIRFGRRSYDHKVPAIQVTVSNEGSMIPQDQMNAIFEKFKQSRKTPAGLGTGLGLAICKEITSAHAGNIWAESSEKLETKFHFMIPYEQERGTRS
ncbi:PAS domain S-box protein [bacterium]|nr:PAS domain S-box protein [bacterium]